MNFHEPIPLPSRLGQADRDTVTNIERSSLLKTRRAGTSAMVEGFRRSTRQHLRTPGQSCLVELPGEERDIYASHETNLREPRRAVVPRPVLPVDLDSPFPGVVRACTIFPTAA